MVGGKAAAEAGAVTHGAVRCSASLCENSFSDHSIRLLISSKFATTDFGSLPSLRSGVFTQPRAWLGLIGLIWQGDHHHADCTNGDSDDNSNETVLLLTEVHDTPAANVANAYDIVSLGAYAGIVETGEVDSGYNADNRK